MDTKLEAEKQQYGVVRVDAVGRRWYTRQFKDEIVAQCLRPEASVSRISIDHGLNTNLVRKWVQRARNERPVVPMLMPVVATQNDVQAPIRSSAIAIEIRIGESRIAIGAEAPALQIEAIVRALR